MSESPINGAEHLAVILPLPLRSHAPIEWVLAAGLAVYGRVKFL